MVLRFGWRYSARMETVLSFTLHSKNIVQIMPRPQAVGAELTRLRPTNALRLRWLLLLLLLRQDPAVLRRHHSRFAGRRSRACETATLMKRQMRVANSCRAGQHASWGRTVLQQCSKYHTGERTMCGEDPHSCEPLKRPLSATACTATTAHLRRKPRGRGDSFQ